jgi:hypothetical protein
MALYKGQDLVSNVGSSPQNLINRPDLWEVGREISFGGNLYGRRFTGNASLVPNVTTTINLVSIPRINIVDAGGRVQYWAGDSNHSLFATAVTPGAGTVSYTSSVHWVAAENRIELRLYSGSTSPSAPYDIWVLYTRI